MNDTVDSICQLQPEQIITCMVNAIDRKQWSVARELFTDTVLVDYSSLNSQPGSNVRSSDLVGGWQKLLDSVSTHHMVSNFEVTMTGDRAESECHVYACHQAEGIAGWDCYGRYLHALEHIDTAWKITEMTLIVHGQKGNLSFLQDIASQSNQ
ncbi:nuclear transport factor 2 family protein [Endozoicomonas sp. SCSIO W0465]|uniref:nuclear transport factor 2 family protein n=1 Tax=Endozoicomonas sp. SCSIO W0465 TaxID=2918516 RepID=UPI0020763B10|nr:nuclear transport factor 2 family protein [Endozoicomonas sp. SCSIO W0465]USE33887.1 nuclear transport factor 2 family protein [Endozoicomonas sp. SCSIO W0465]